MLIIAILAASVLLQLIAAILALRAMRESHRYHAAWIALSLALALMVERRAVPLHNALNGNPQDGLNAWFGLMISLLMAFSLVGLGRLLHALRENDERLTHLATTDTLTGLANRRHILASLDAELRRAQRTGRPLTLLMLDLDHFKAINDRYGHAIGDAVLVATTRRCQDGLRDMDHFGRVGGEEFLVVLPETGFDEARITAERLRAALANAPIETDAGPLAVTMSLGMATLPIAQVSEPRAVIDIDRRAEGLMKDADQALYRAKSDGRNCLRF